MKKLLLLTLLITMVFGFLKPLDTHALEVTPKITSIQPVNFVTLSK